ncbi:hypothetical protein CLAFUW4_03891 [Fulvia fulva]|uniref:J domain-containing protein n=1 Tax=Passalora fulva TaxID=5499 RepID=A0A9Q8LBV4_PASFU|nr:uncharacterized protein CLAFUR5_03861 [Fulvia fulva]KAK4631015.1 hypothetical protein CLAFUR4_03879 [Fulvia fulva]KAK4633304.1 hypothetical protein CLAFUR0_03878 [Fulvia fulva]UJO14379.1 hypothetical protein CLAFUR5_03861 [Fulvia fulva]WPV11857.1 hypothetical protein CLAFUW4_03891 [Fulvia fulva]WPV25724.1 hypothetical protein CLAFUW7_03882 [Fulvia fulva]
MARAAFDPFEALGLPRDASSQTIKSRYHALARKYHPNRHQGSDEAKATLAEHFHNVHQAWKLLSNVENRRRRTELLNLLELQDAMLTTFMDLLNAQSPDEPHPDQPQPVEHSEHDGNISSDADEDLPNVGLQRRQTFRNHGVKHLGDRRGSVDDNSPTSPTKKSLKWSISKAINARASAKQDQQKESDYFSQRRKKLEKLRRKELEAFFHYRDAMVAKFEAEEEVERHHAQYEQAKWKREYFERAPRGTTERFRSFQHFMGAVSAFGDHTPRRRNHSTLSYSTMSPIVGPGEGPQFLGPDHALARSKTMHHKRGWSSDISGDQTDSSDDEPSEINGTKHISPPIQWHQLAKRSQNTNRDYPRRSHHRTSSGLSEGDSPGPEFKVVVRQPSDLGRIEEANDSSNETLSNSSRSPSPHPDAMNSLQLYKFRMLPSSGTADLFGMPSEGRARSPSPVGRRRFPSMPEVPKAPRVSPSDGLKFETKLVGPPQYQHVHYDHVHQLSREEKSRILGAEPDTELDPAVLLERLSGLSTTVADKFEIKPNMEELFRFRLIYGTREVTRKQHQSFIALSYRRKIHVEKEKYHYTLPLDPEIYQAVWDERESDNEGVWIDQICIDQDSDFERTISMSAMDMVYRSARIVVVALDDIELEAHEGELLQSHMDEYESMKHVAARHRFRRKHPPYLESHDHMYKVIRKILRSSWFKRAWCRHEMRLAKHHVFLIPCKRPGTWSGRAVLRFNGKCIAHLLDLSIEVPFEPDVESVKPALHAFFRDRAKMATGEREMRLHHGNFSTVVAEVFAMEAGGDPRIPAERRLSDARKDKISIILNTMECGLTLRDALRNPSIHVTDNECYHLLSLLALAAQDPGALCCVGAPLPITDSTSSWLYTPTVADAGLNNFKTLDRLPENAHYVTSTSGPEHYIQLDLKFLPRDKAWTPSQDLDTLELARYFIATCDERKWGRNRKRYLTHDRKANLLFGSMHEVYVETLACIFHCGPNWMSDVCQRYSMSRWKVDLKGAYELLIALANTHGRWPVDAWSERAAGFIMDFVNFLTIRGLPQRQISKPEPWRPFVVASTGQVLGYAPIADEHIQLAIPTVLINPDYVHLARLWILAPRTTPSLTNGTTSSSATSIPIPTITLNDENISDWTLSGKSVLFSDEAWIGKMSTAQYRGDFQEQQKVYGRQLQRQHASNGVIRDRKLLRA